MRNFIKQKENLFICFTNGNIYRMPMNVMYDIHGYSELEKILLNTSNQLSLTEYYENLNLTSNNINWNDISDHLILVSNIGYRYDIEYFDCIKNLII